MKTKKKVALYVNFNRVQKFKDLLEDLYIVKVCNISNISSTYKKCDILITDKINQTIINAKTSILDEVEVLSCSSISDTRTKQQEDILEDIIYIKKLLDKKSNETKKISSTLVLLTLIITIAVICYMCKLIEEETLSISTLMLIVSSILFKYLERNEDKDGKSVSNNK